MNGYFSTGYKRIDCLIMEVSPVLFSSPRDSPSRTRLSLLPRFDPSNNRFIRDLIVKASAGSASPHRRRLHAASPQTDTGRLDDGVDGAAAAGAGSVRQLFRLRDRRRRVHHHRPGDF